MPRTRKPAPSGPEEPLERFLRDAQAHAAGGFAADRPTALDDTFSVAAAPITHRSTLVAAGVLVPLVVGMHAAGGTPTTFDATSRWVAYSEAQGFACAIPASQTLNDPNVQNAWGYQNGYVLPENQDYLAAMIPAWCAALGADPKRVFLTGFSAGAFMALRMAHIDIVEIAGVIPLSGWDGYLSLWGPPTRTRPIALLDMMGTNDLYPVAGQGVLNGQRVTAMNYATILGLAGAPTVVQPAVGTPPGSTVETWPGRAVETRVIINGTHQYPGSPQAIGANIPVDATAIIAAWIKTQAPSSSPVANTALPVVSGPLAVGGTLTSTAGSWAGGPTGFAYQWQLETGIGTNVYVNVSGRTANTYLLAGGDVGRRLRCAVTASLAGAAFGGLLAPRLGESTGAVVNVATNSALVTAIGAAGPGTRINVTASIDGGGALLTIGCTGSFANPVTITRNAGVLLTNYSQINVRGSKIRLRGLDVGYATIDNVKIDTAATDIEIDGCLIHDSTRMGINVQSAPVNVQIWNCTIHDNGSPSNGNLDHGIYFAYSGGTGVIANNLLYDNCAYNLQVYPNSPGIIVSCNTMDGGMVHANARGGMVVGSEGGLTDNVTVVGLIGTNAAWYAIDVYDPAAGDTGNRGFDCIGFGNGSGDFRAGGGFTYVNCTHADPLYVNRGARDYHLLPGSPAVGHIQPAQYGYVPPFDKDGLPRVTADAGCYRA